MNKEYFVKLIIDVCSKFRPLIMNAPAKKGWDPIFRKSIDSQYTVKARRNGAIQAIAEEAAMFGFDLSEIVGAIEDKDEK
jgi:hypothetical protein|tara:strand:+ start:450 stop:689 length:240 start_codon:yes stop_codon:yes gene_type:complete